MAEDSDLRGDLIRRIAARRAAVQAYVREHRGKSQDDVARLSTAEAANAELDGLMTLLEFGHLQVDDAVKLYQQYSTQIPFIDDLAGVGAGVGRSGSGSSVPPQR